MGMVSLKKLNIKLNKNEDTSTESLKREDDEFVNDSKAALLDKVTPLANVILYSILVLLVVLVAWASLSTIEEVSVGDGKVISSSKNKIIQSLDGGIVKQIFVKEGEQVKQGQILLILDNTRYKSDYEAALEKYYALLAMNARLVAETQHKDKIDFPKEIQDLPDLKMREQKLFDSRREGLTSKVANLQKSLDLSNNEVTILGPLVLKGFAPKLDLIRAERNVNDIKGKIKDEQDKFIEDALQALATHKAEMEETSKTLASLQDKMRNTVIRSPVKGIVKKINVNTIGGVITPGMDILEIVPLDESLLIEARIRPLDIAFIHPGQKATVKITAYDYTIYGSLKGHVESVSADSIEDERAKSTEGANAPSIYYRVDIRVAHPYLGSEKHKLPILPGMQASVHILTGEKTVLKYLLKPLIKAKEEALRER
jgi:adhesin transport system membrane fusion protein